MKVLSFGEILLRLASPGYTKLFQKDSLDATFCGGEANVAVSLANFTSALTRARPFLRTVEWDYIILKRELRSVPLR